MAMLRFKDWPILAKIALAPTVGLIVLIGIAISGVMALKAQQADYQRLQQQEIASQVDMLHIASQLQQLNAKIFELATKEAAGLSNDTDSQRLEGLAGDAEAIVKDLTAYRERFDPDHGEERLTAMLESLTTYKDAVDFLASMLAIDFNSAVGFVMPFQDTLREIHTDMADLVTQADTMSTEQTDRIGKEAAFTQQIFVGATVFAIIIVGALSWASAQATSTGVRDIAALTQRIAERDKDVNLEAYARKDALGEIVQSLRVFRENQTEVDRLQEERAAADKKAAQEREAQTAERERLAQERAAEAAEKAAAAERAAEEREQHMKEREALSAERAAEEEKRRAERQEMLRELQSAFGQVVDAVAAGDFSVRVEPRYKEAELNALADGLNHLVSVVAKGIDETKRVLNALAHSDLTQRMTGDFSGTFADLKDYVNSTGESLADVIQRLLTAAGTLRELTSNLSEGSDQLAGRTTHQAATVEEATAALSSILNTVKENADRADQAQSNAASAHRLAVAGGDIMDQATRAIARIAEASEKMADTVGVIEGIAFQTNILALNASVEAARAGAAGAGFAVVANEVRSLAQSAAERSNQIKTLNQSASEEVAAGVDLITKAADTLKEIVSAVATSNELVSAIANANKTQAVSISEFGEGITQIDQVTQQNAALVQDTNEIVTQAKDQADSIDRILSDFTIEPAHDMPLKAVG